MLATKINVEKRVLLLKIKLEECFGCLKPVCVPFMIMGILSPILEELFSFFFPPFFSLLLLFLYLLGCLFTFVLMT